MDGFNRCVHFIGFHGELELDHQDEVLDLLARVEHPCCQLLQLSRLYVVHKLCRFWLDSVLCIRGSQLKRLLSDNSID